MCTIWKNKEKDFLASIENLSAPWTLIENTVFKGKGEKQ